VRAEPRSRWRPHVKSALASAIAGVHDHRLGAVLARRTVRPLVLGYHRVVDDFAVAARTEIPSTLISRDMFERHIDWLGGHFRFAGLDEIGNHLQSGEPFDEPVVAITFDDGYRDVYEQAFPVLERKGIPAAIFVVTDLVGRPFWQHHDRLYRFVAKAFATWEDPQRKLRALFRDLDIPADVPLASRAALTTPLTTVAALLPGLSLATVGRVLEGLESAVGNGFGPAPLTVTWPMLADMRRAGWVIGSHSATHPSLPTESPATVADEVERSKREIERHLGQPVAHFAYPGGHFTRPVVDALHTAGYRFAYTACPHGDARYPQLTIERRLLWEGSSVDADGHFSAGILSCQAHRLWPPGSGCRGHHG
jgi:peptidoglycan/xylan/chitin deacetylase (PgdA/CDA1 family)